MKSLGIYNFLKEISSLSHSIVFFHFFALIILAIPFATICTVLLQLTVDGDSILYQIYLCIPALTAFTVAASIALRRNAYTKTGFFIQFVGPVLFFVPLVLESIFYNIFG